MQERSESCTTEQNAAQRSRTLHNGAERCTTEQNAAQRSRTLHNGAERCRKEQLAGDTMSLKQPSAVAAAADRQFTMEIMQSETEELLQLE
jgi:hypothetical protein